MRDIALISGALDRQSAQGEAPKLSSIRIAEEMKKKFGNRTEIIAISMKYQKQIGSFIRKIEKAHKEAGKSNLLFS